MSAKLTGDGINVGNMMASYNLTSSTVCFQASRDSCANRRCFRYTKALLFFLMNLAVLICNARSEATETTQRIVIRINVTGASNTKCNVIPGVTCYWKQARPEFSKRSLVINSAVNGSTAAEFNQQFVERVLPYYDRRFKYNILALQTGGNDILANASGETTFDNLKAIVSKWKALGPRTFAVIATVPRFGYSSSQLPEADKLNRLILSERSFDATFDIGSIPSLNYGTNCPPVTITPDCSHLTTAGNRLVSKLFVIAINAVLSPL
jgi:hypothetical protein